MHTNIFTKEKFLKLVFFTGVGYAMVTVSLIVCIYYNVIMSYTVYYTIASFSSVVPWSECNPDWADLNTCYIRNSSATDNSTNAVTNSTRETASLQYWE